MGILRYKYVNCIIIINNNVIIICASCRRAKLGQIQGGLQRAIQDSTKGGVAIIFYFLRVKNINF